ncbi:TPA: hypothetical protein SAY52_004426 [Burkholderia cenocepacia]|uniref:hypothetical protein n=1 Tax=unclassified Burkholderia TaxID=2613784 RepID=UPI0015896FE8|nr:MULTISPECIES: hypothetical protein [unclassified Burkholderia]HEF5873767.1 hypothetical protein [Burkholderia cenocepacia]
MKPTVIRPLQALCLSSAVALVAWAVCAAQSPRFLDTIEAVGSDTELPLERMASGSAFAATQSHAAHGAVRMPAHLPAWNAAGYAGPPRQAPVGKRLGHAGRAPGYRHSIDDSKDWT